MGTFVKVALWLTGIPMLILGILAYLYSGVDEGAGLVPLGALGVAFVGSVLCSSHGHVVRLVP